MADSNRSDSFTFNESVYNSSMYIGNISDPKMATTLSLQPEKVYWALVMVPLPLVAVFGNILVILSVYREKSLQSATNYFIVSLAFADLLVAAVVMPFAVYVLVNVNWELSETLCDFYIALDVTCSTASIFNLVAISIDRYIAVTQPIKYCKHKNKKRVLLTIIFVWLVSAAIGSPIVLGLNTSAERLPHLCVFYNSDFIIYSSLSSFYIPCLVMICLYYQIFGAIRERARKALQQKAGPIFESDPKEYANTPRTALLSPSDCKQKLMPLVEADETSHMLSTDCRTLDKGIKGNTKDEDNNASYHCLSDKGNGTMNKHIEETQLEDVSSNMKPPVDTSDEVGVPDAVATSTISFKVNGSAAVDHSCSDGTNKVKKGHASRGLFGGHVKPQKEAKKKREKNAARRERKATKTLAIVLGVFLMCWVPFFTCNILDAICIKLQSDQCRPGVTAFLLTTWLGYINSCVNPVIYTIFNMEFRKAFKKLLLEPCK